MAEYAGEERQDLATGLEFFELMHVIPRKFEVGFVFATQTLSILVFNGHRKTDVTWSDFINGAGDGVSLLNAPTFPETVYALGTFAAAIATPMLLEVTQDGQATVDSTLDFAFSSGTVSVPITLERVVAFIFRPENDYQESLEWLTDVLPHKDGTEQRPSLRKNCRQFFDFTYFVADTADEAQAFENFLFDWQDNTFGLPIWHEERVTTAAISATDTSIPVDSTAYADFRVGGLVLILDEENDVFEVLSISAVNPTSIDTDNPIANDYPAGVAVLPMVPTIVGATLSGTRFLNNAGTLRIKFESVDNDIDIDSLAAFSTFNSKLLLDGYNFSEGSSSETYERQINRFDNQTGLVTQDSSWDRSKRISPWSVVVGTPQDLWEHRQMLHAIRGRQTSFYLIRSRSDLVPNDDLTSGTNDLFVEHVGYTDYVQSRQPKNVIRVTFNNGDPALLRTVTSSSEVSPTQELLELDANWPSTYATSDVARIEYVEKVRFDSDRITILHFGGGGYASRISAPVKAVFD